jgi:hypothetical protein
MDGPLSVVLNLSYDTEMLIGVLVGMGFGLALERAGFGRSTNLTSVFYGRDFRVLRVMFTAIATAMVGLYFLDLLRILPLPSIGILDTYLWAALVGGLVFGAGFVIGGWCPGTSVVGLASGKVDALLFIGGLVLGSVLFTLGFADLRGLADAGARGRVLLHEFFHLSSGSMVFLVALFAVGAFAAAGRIERAIRGRLGGERPAPAPADDVSAAA